MSGGPHEPGYLPYQWAPDPDLRRVEEGAAHISGRSLAKVRGSWLLPAIPRARGYRTSVTRSVASGSWLLHMPRSRNPAPHPVQEGCLRRGELPTYNSA